MGSVLLVTSISTDQMNYIIKVHMKQIGPTWYDCHSFSNQLRQAEAILVVSTQLERARTLIKKVKVLR